MFDTPESVLRRAKCDDICIVWVSYFTGKSGYSQMVGQAVPTLSPYQHLFEYQPVDKTVIKKSLMKANTKQEMQQMLLEMLPLSNPLDFQFFDVFNSGANFKIMPSSIGKLVFKASMRFFCQLAYQIPAYLEKAIKGDSKCINLISNLQSLLIFFTTCDDQQFRDFEVVLNSLMENLRVYWDVMIATDTDPLLTKYSIDFVIGLVSCVQVEVSYKIRESFCMSFIVEQMYKIFGMFKGDDFTPDLAIQIRGVLTILLTVVNNISETHKTELCCAAIHLLDHICTYTKLDASDIFQLGSICMRIYSDCSHNVKSDLISFEFNVMINFVIWTITNFATKSFSREEAFPMKRASFTLFTESLKPQQFLSKQPSLREIVSFDFDEQLTNVAERLKHICTERNNAGPLTQLMLARLKDKREEFGAEQYRTFTAFIIQVIGSSYLGNVCKALEKDWDILLSDTVYPYDPWTLEDHVLRDAMNFFLYRCYKNVIPRRVDILNEITNYLERSGNPDAIYHFWPLFVQLLKDIKTVAFLEHFMKSPLVLKVLPLAIVDVAVFDFIRTAVYLDPVHCLCNTDVCNVMIEAFFDERMMSSVLSCFANGLGWNANRNIFSNFKKNIFQSICAIMSKYVEKNGAHLPELLSVLESSANFLTPEMIDFCSKIGLFDQLARITVTIKDIMFISLKFFLTMCRQNEMIIEKISSDAMTFYEILEGGFSDKMNSEQTIKLLFELATISTPTKGARSTIRNHRAIELVLEYAKYCRNEHVIVEGLSELAKYPPNINELNNGSIMVKILNRLRDVQEDEFLRSKYLSLYKTIAEKMFTISTLYKTIELVKCPTFMYANDILTILMDLLCAEQSTAPSSYFAFDGKETGIFLPLMSLGEAFSVCASIKPQWSESSAPVQPLLTVACDCGDKTTFQFIEGKLHVKRNTIEVGVFPFTFEKGEWYFIVVTVTSHGYMLTVNGQPSMKIESPLHYTNPILIYIGSASKDRFIRSLVADISTIFVFKTADIRSMKPRMTLPSLPPSLAASVVCCLNPANAQQNHILNVSPTISSAEFRGKSVPFFSTIHNVLPSSGALSNIIPLFSRLFDDSLQRSNGVNILSVLINLLGRIMTLSETAQRLFYDIHGFELLASYLLQVNDAYFGPQHLTDFLKLFKAISIRDLAVQMIDSIWMNFDISKKFGECQCVYFSSCVLLAYQMNPTLFQDVLSMESVLYQAVTMFPEECPSGNDCWHFIQEMVKDSVRTVSISALLSVAVSHVSSYASRKSLSIIGGLVKQMNLGNVVELQDFYTSLLLTLQYPELQHLSFNIVDALFVNNPASQVDRMLIKATRVFTVNDARESAILIGRHLFDNRRAIVRPYYLPLYVKVVTGLDLENREKGLYDLTNSIMTYPDHIHAITFIPYWYIYIFSLSESCKIPDADFANLYMYLLDATMSKMRNSKALVEFFDFLSVKLTDYRWLKRRILHHLLRNGQTNPYLFDILVHPVFEFCFFRTFPRDKSCAFHLIMDVNQTRTEWRDMEITMRLLDLFDPSRRVNNSFINLVVAYMVAHQMYFGVDKHFVRVSHMNCDMFTMHQVVGVVRFNAEKVGKHVFTDFESEFDDENDSDALQYFMFEEHAIKNMRARSQALCNMKKQFTDMKTAVAASVEKDKERHARDAKRFIDRQKLRHETNNMLREKLRQSFTGTFCTGPWSQSEESPKFKLAPIVGRRGRKAILLPNRHFVDHADAAALRDNSPIESSSEDGLRVVYKPVHTINVTQRSGFTADARLVNVSGVFDGIVSVRDKLVSFDGKSTEDRVKRIYINVDDIGFILNRTYASHDTACEIFTSKYRSYFIVFGEMQREKFYECFDKHKPSFSRDAARTEEKKFDFLASLRRVCGSVYQNTASHLLLMRLRITDLWQNYTLTTYEYLYYINMLAGRSFNVPCLYPIYPWLIKETQAEVIDLTDESIYRNLGVSSTILSERRKKRADDQWHVEVGDEDCQFRFHYLPAAHVYNYLIRFEPFVTQHIVLQKKFDHPNRLFFSIPDLWSELYGDGSSARESVPEFYTCPQVLVNENKYDLGVLAEGDRVDDVILPKWSRNNFHYTAVNRAALEGKYASEHIHEWIDLIFGVYRESERKYTVFHPLMYAEKTLNDQNNVERKGAVMLEFGSIPMQLFISSHPHRNEPRRTKISSIHIGDNLTVSCMKKQIIFCSPSTLIDARRSNTPKREILKRGYGQMWAVSRSLGLAVFGTGSDMFISIVDVTTGCVKKVSHDISLITCATVIGGDHLITGGSDCSLQVWKLPAAELISVSSFHCEPVIAIGGCADIGLVVSIDRLFNVVFETLFQNKFIRVLKLNTLPSTVPFISVFKSGTVVIVHEILDGTEILMFDSRGEFLKSQKLENKVVDVNKYYDFDTREYIIVATEAPSIQIFDAPTLSLIVTYPVNSRKPKFCTIKNGQSCLIESGNRLVAQEFDSAIESVVHSITV